MEFHFHKSHIRQLLYIDDMRQELDNIIEELSDDETNVNIPGINDGELNLKMSSETNNNQIEVIKNKADILITKPLGKVAISSTISYRYRELY